MSIMDSRTSKRVPVIASEAFYRATYESMFNATANSLKIDHQAVVALQEELRNMGQTRFLNMTCGIEDSRESLVLYAGDGNVIKIQPTSIQGGDFIYQIPPISQRIVHTDLQSYSIETFPFITSRGETIEDVKTLQHNAQILGLNIHDGDDTPRNMRKLPDGMGTITSLDRNTFSVARSGLNYGPETLQAWHNYLAQLFPIYKIGEIPKQTPDTNFAYIMNYDHNHHIQCFDPLSQNPITYAHDDKSTSNTKRSFWSFFISEPGHD